MIIGQKRVRKKNEEQEEESNKYNFGPLKKKTRRGFAEAVNMLGRMSFNKGVIILLFVFFYRTI